MFKVLHTTMQIKNPYEAVRQRDLANLMGIHETIISKWKKGERLITDISDYHLISELTGKPIDWLYTIATGACKFNENRTIRQIRREQKKRALR